MLLKQKTDQPPRGLLCRVLTDAVQSVHRHGLEGAPHHGVLLKHLVEAVHAQRVQPAVGVRPDAGRPPTPCQQTDLWTWDEGEGVERGEGTAEE